MNKIEKRTLGKSGIKVTKMGIGLWAVGGTSWGATEDADSLSTIDRALEGGITFFDTADVYGDGHSEELLGQAMKGRREKFILGTKMGWKGFDHQGKVSVFTSVERVIQEVEGNLSRLKTDHIDILQNHIGFREPNMEIVLEAFEKLKVQGKIRAYGVSTSDFEYLKAFNGDGGCSTLQIDYSILNRTAEKEIFPYCLENNIGVIVRGPLAMGILTGKFNRDSKFSAGDFRSRWYENKEEYKIFLDDLEKVEKLKDLCSDRTLAQLALEFVMTQKAVTTVIPGAKNTKQLNDNITAAHHKPLTAEEWGVLNEITKPMGGRKIWPA